MSVVLRKFGDTKSVRKKKSYPAQRHIYVKKDELVVVQTNTIFNEPEAWSACEVLEKGVKVNSTKKMYLPSLVRKNKMSVGIKKIFGKCYHF